MPNLPVPNTLELKIHWGGAAVELGQNVLHFLNVGAVVVNQALADSLDSSIKGIFTTSGLAAQIAPNYGIRNVGVRNLALANQAEFVATGAGILGNAVGDALPTAIAQCYTLRTALAGRSFRGRAYIPCWAESTSNGSVQTVGSSAGTSFLDNIRTSLIASPNLHMCIVSRRSNGVDRPTPITNEVNLVQLRSTNWNTQRRRMVAGGPGQIALLALPQVEMLPASSWQPAGQAAQDNLSASARSGV